MSLTHLLIVASAIPLVVLLAIATFVYRSGKKSLHGYYDGRSYHKF